MKFSAVGGGLGRHCASAALAIFLLAPSASAAQLPDPGRDWPVFGGDPGNSKHSPLDQIDRGNFADVEIAWRWRSIAFDTEVPRDVRRGQFKTVPIKVGERIFVSTSLGQVAAIDAATGTTIWTHDAERWRAGRPANDGFHHRGVAWWTDGERERILMPTHDRRLVSLDRRERASRSCLRRRRRGRDDAAPRPQGGRAPDHPQFAAGCLRRHGDRRFDRVRRRHACCS